MDACQWKQRQTGGGTRFFRQSLLAPFPSLSDQSIPTVFQRLFFFFCLMVGFFFFLSFNFLFHFLKHSYLFGCSRSWLWQVGPLIFLLACGIFSCGTQTLSCSMGDLVP